ncbi:MAG: hypothetical protein R2867_35855 [Caldilineaceae bacterium]
MTMHTIKPKEQIDFETNKRLLNRYRFIEYECLRILAGWLPATAMMEWKLAMGRLLWEDAQHVQQLYQRLREVQTPAFRPPGDDALAYLMAEAIHAPTAADLLAGIFRVIKPALVDAYRWHIDQTFANPDAPTLYAFRHILLDEEAQVQWGAVALAEHGRPMGAVYRRAAGRGRWRDWSTSTYTTTRDTGQSCPVSRPRHAARDERFSLVNRQAGQVLTDPDLADAAAVGV